MVELQNIPELRFPEFDGEYCRKKLEETCVIKTGNKDTQNRIENGQYPFYVRSNKVERINSFSYDGEAILTSGDGVGVGKIFHYINGKFDYHQRVYCLREFNIDYSGKFIFYIFTERFYKRIMKLSAKNSVDSVRMDMISKMEIRFPSLPEQQKIASFLTAVDKRVELLTQKHTLLEQYKKGVMQKIFSQELRFKDEDGNDFPEWEDKKLGAIGYTYNGLTGKTKQHFGQGKPFIQYMQIFNGTKIDISKYGYVEINEGDNQNKVQYGDVFFTTSSETPNEIGMSSVLLDIVEETYLNSFCFGYRPNSLDVVVPEFAQFLFRSENVRKEIVKLAQGSTRFNMSKVEFMKQSVHLPHLLEQQKIAQFLSAIDKKIEQVSIQIEKNKKFKKGLLQKMFV